MFICSYRAVLMRICWWWSSLCGRACRGGTSSWWRCWCWRCARTGTLSGSVHRGVRGWCCTSACRSAARRAICLVSSSHTSDLLFGLVNPFALQCYWQGARMHVNSISFLVDLYKFSLTNSGLIWLLLVLFGLSSYLTWWGAWTVSKLGTNWTG